MPKSADPDDYVECRIALAALILVILLGAAGWTMNDAGKPSNTPTKSSHLVINPHHT